MVEPTWIQIAQFIAYVSLTVTGVTVAAASLFISYRNNFGWKPVVFISSMGFKGDSANDGGRMYARMSLEFWNRRNYPLVLRFMRIELKGLEVDEDGYSGKTRGDWNWQQNKMAFYRKQHTIQPKSNIEITISGRLKEGQSLDAIDAAFHLTVGYYDPRRNKEVTINERLPYSLKARR